MICTGGMGRMYHGTTNAFEFTIPVTLPAEEDCKLTFTIDIQDADSPLGT